MKYYHAENANRIIAGLIFNTYDTIAGSHFAVHATEDEAEIKALDDLVKDKKSAVTEISEAEYVKCTQKKTTATVDNSKHYRQLSALRNENASLKGTGAAVVSNEPVEEAPVAVAGPVESVDAALQVGDVNPAESPETVSESAAPEPPSPQAEAEPPPKGGRKSKGKSTEAPHDS